MYLSQTLQMLEIYVRQPCEGTLIDRYVFLPVKMYYLNHLKREVGYRTD